jgi:hypothetical protein
MFILQMSRLVSKLFSLNSQLVSQMFDRGEQASYFTALGCCVQRIAGAWPDAVKMQLPLR